MELNFRPVRSVRGLAPSLVGGIVPLGPYLLEALVPSA
jgi:hypothetical protein